MFDDTKVSTLSVPRWEAVYRAEIYPGVESIVAVHDTSRGSALGGCRMAMYNNEAEALTDALRLSRGMTFKNAIADLPLGGGKSVIVCDPQVSGRKREEILEEFGKFIAWVNREGDLYYTAEDMNTTVADMHTVQRYTRNITGTRIDPSPYTAWGVFCAIEFSVDYFAMDLFNGERSLKGRKVMIQGLGKVGLGLLEHLDEAGAELYITDISERSIKRALEICPKAQVVAPDEFLNVEVDVFAPCARGEVITRRNLEDLKFKVLCGAANNQLQKSKTGRDLQRRGIIFSPDYVANMGGVCAIQYLEFEKLSHEETLKRIKTTVRKMLGLTFRTAFRKNIAFNEAVDLVVKHIIWGQEKSNLDFSNEQLFPYTYVSEPND